MSLKVLSGSFLAARKKEEKIVKDDDKLNFREIQISIARSQRTRESVMEICFFTVDARNYRRQLVAQKVD